MNIVTYGLFSHSPVVAQLEQRTDTTLTTSLDYLDDHSLHDASLVVSTADVDASELRPLCGKLFQSLQTNPGQQVLLVGEQPEVPIPLRPLAIRFRDRFHIITNHDITRRPEHLQSIIDTLLPCAA